MLYKQIIRCPHCGEIVSTWSKWCWLCGYDLKRSYNNEKTKKFFQKGKGRVE